MLNPLLSAVIIRGVKSNIFFIKLPNITQATRKRDVTLHLRYLLKVKSHVSIYSMSLNFVRFFFLLTIWYLFTAINTWENHAKHSHQQSYSTVRINNSVTIWRWCAILHCRHRRTLSAAKAAIWQVSCMLSTCTSPPSLNTSLCRSSTLSHISLYLIPSLYFILTPFAPLFPPITLPSITAFLPPYLHLVHLHVRLPPGLDHTSK